MSLWAVDMSIWHDLCIFHCLFRTPYEISSVKLAISLPFSKFQNPVPVFLPVLETCPIFLRQCQKPAPALNASNPNVKTTKKTSFLHCVLLPLSFRCLSGPFFPSTRRNFDLPSVCWQQCVPFNARNRKQKSYHICHFFAFTSFTLIWVRSTQLPNTRMNNVFWRIWMWETGERSDGCCWLFLR